MGYKCMARKAASNGSLTATFTLRGHALMRLAIISSPRTFDSFQKSFNLFCYQISVEACTQVVQDTKTWNQSICYPARRALSFLSSSLDTLYSEVTKIWFRWSPLPCSWGDLVVGLRPTCTPQSVLGRELALQDGSGISRDLLSPSDSDWWFPLT